MKWFGTPQFLKNEESVHDKSILMKHKPYVLINRPIQLTQCCTQFKSPGVKIRCALYLHYNVAFTFKLYGNS